MLFGLLVAVLPFLGFPSNWNEIFYVVIGLLVVVVAYRLAPKPKADSKTNLQSLPFTEHQNNSSLVKKPMVDSVAAPENKINKNSSSIIGQ